MYLKSENLYPLLNVNVVEAPQIPVPVPGSKPANWTFVPIALKLLFTRFKLNSRKEDFYVIKIFKWRKYIWNKF